MSDREARPSDASDFAFCMIRRRVATEYGIWARIYWNYKKERANNNDYGLTQSYSSAYTKEIGLWKGWNILRAIWSSSRGFSAAGKTYHHIYVHYTQTSLKRSSINCSSAYSIFLPPLSNLTRANPVKATQVQHRCQLSMIQTNHWGLFCESWCCSKLMRIL